MKIAHFSDLHYCPEHISEVDRCFLFAIEDAIARGAECAVISGDLFDHRVELHQPAVSLLLYRVRTLADRMPVLILQGTFSHDQPGSLDVFRTIGGRYPVHVADQIQQVAWSTFNREWFATKPGQMIDLDRVPEASALFSCLPPVHKGAVAAKAGAENAATAAGELVLDLMRGWAVINEQANAVGIPTVVVSHGTVTGCITEHGVPMHGMDHEFTTGSLFASKAGAIMLGHIHQHQNWPDDTRTRIIAYPGSIGRLHFGEVSPKGYLLWDVGSGMTNMVEFIETPAKRLIQLEYEGLPDMDALTVAAETCAHAHVRIRWTVPESHKDTIDKDAIRGLFAAADVVKLEPRIIPIQRQRAAGITRAISVGDKLLHWCRASETQADPLEERLRMLETMEPYDIVEQLISGVTTQAGKTDTQEDAA